MPAFSAEALLDSPELLHEEMRLAITSENNADLNFEFVNRSGFIFALQEAGMICQEQNSRTINTDMVILIFGAFRGFGAFEYSSFGKLLKQQ